MGKDGPSPATIPLTKEYIMNIPVTQDIVSQAYKRWQENDWTRGQFIDQLSITEREAVLIGNFNYQVGNGGFRQWVDNGYGLEARELVRVLEKLNTELSPQVKAFVEQLIPHINFNLPNKGWSEYWITEGSNDNGYSFEDEEDDYYYEEEEPEGVKIAEKLDDQYYAIAEDFMQEVESYFTQVSTEEIS